MKEHKGSACHRNLPSSYDSGAQVRNRGCVLTDRLKVRATRPLAQGCGTKSVPRQGHNTPFPLERSPPVSFKRLLGSVPGHPIVGALNDRTPKLLEPRAVVAVEVYFRGVSAHIVEFPVKAHKW